MNPQMSTAQEALVTLLEQSELTLGMLVRVHGDHLILGRDQQLEPDGPPERIETIRFTHVGSSTFGLSVKRHTGRWERTPFSGSIPEMVEVMRSFMQHLITPI
jgi:hypothetical protein